MAAGYRKAIEWIARNDDVDLGGVGADAVPLISVCLIADLFGKETDDVTRAVMAYRARMEKGEV